MTDDELERSLVSVLASRPRYVALQEVGPDRDDLVRRITHERGYRLVRAKGGPAVLYLASATEPLHVKPLVLSHAAWVGRLIGRKSNLPASIASEVLFEDDVLGELAFIGAHLDAEVQTGGGYRTDADHAPRVRRHKKQRRRLERRGRHHVRKHRRVRICLDGNFDGLELDGLVSCWTGRDGLGTLEGPKGGLSDRAVDIIFAEIAAVDVDRIATDSDHRAVIATYPEEKR